MEKGFTVTTILMPKDTIIEVVNYQTVNGVFNIGWVNRIPTDIAKYDTTVGIWKIKKLK